MDLLLDGLRNLTTFNKVPYGIEYIKLPDNIVWVKGKRMWYNTGITHKEWVEKSMNGFAWLKQHRVKADNKD